jgi:hypothetical protein
MSFEKSGDQSLKKPLIEADKMKFLFGEMISEVILSSWIYTIFSTYLDW